MSAAFDHCPRRRPGGAISRSRSRASCRMVIVTALPVLRLAAGGAPPLGAVARRAARHRARRGGGEHAQHVRRARPRRADGAHAAPPAAGRRARRRARRSSSGSRSRRRRRSCSGSRAAPAAALGVASILFYVFVYTIWLKPRSVYNAVIGGAAGAAAPLIADAAVNGQRRAAGPAAVRDRVLLAAAARLGDRAVPQRRLRGRRHPDAARGGRRRAHAPPHGGLHARARARDARCRACSDCSARSISPRQSRSARGSCGRCVRLVRERSDAAARACSASRSSTSRCSTSRCSSTCCSAERRVDLSFLPSVNAALNLVSTVLLVRRPRSGSGAAGVAAHRRTMLSCVRGLEPVPARSTSRTRSGAASRTRPSTARACSACSTSRSCSATSRSR